MITANANKRHLRLVISWGKPILTPEEKWIEVKLFYERSTGKVFHRRPTDDEIKFLYEKMKKLTVELDFFYRHNPRLKKKLDHVRGHVTEVLKRKASE